MPRRGALALLLYLLILSCAHPFVPHLAEPMVPPPVYRTWYAEVKECSGKQGDFTRIWWFVHPGRSWRYGEYLVNGLESRRHITLAQAYVLDEAVVKHEMLHALGFTHWLGNEPPYPWPFTGCTGE